MEKKHLETFINKYSLNGILDEVRWTVKDETLKVSAMTTDKKLLATVLLKKFENVENTEFGILDSPKVKQMLGVLGENVSVTLIKDEEDDTRILSLQISDATCDMKHTVSDAERAQKSLPKMKDLPTFGVEIAMTDEFIERFLRAKASLPDVDAFTFAMNPKKKKLEMVFGHGKNNYNRIGIEVPAVADKNTVAKPISFSAKTLKEIISANSEVKDPILKVSEDGLASIEFDKNEFQSQYYLIRVDIED